MIDELEAEFSSGARIPLEVVDGPAGIGRAEGGSATTANIVTLG